MLLKTVRTFESFVKTKVKRAAHGTGVIVFGVPKTFKDNFRSIFNYLFQGVRNQD